MIKRFKMVQAKLAKTLELFYVRTFSENFLNFFVYLNYTLIILAMIFIGFPCPIKGFNKTLISYFEQNHSYFGKITFFSSSSR